VDSHRKSTSFVLSALISSSTTPCQGVDVLKAVKEIDPSIPVIMITANPDNAVAAEVLQRGAFSYFPKPFDLRYLDHLTAAALSERSR
jgi:DNA-binding NtrC family response regulator